MLNQVNIIGNLGADPEIRSFQNGGRVANLRVAVTEKWKDKNSGEQKERTEWVSIAILNDGLVGVAERFLRKGSKVFVSGKLQTRKWQDQSGNDRYSTEVVLQGFDAKLVMLDGANGQGSTGGADSSGRGGFTGNGGNANRQPYRGESGHIPGFDPAGPDDDSDMVPFMHSGGIW